MSRFSPSPSPQDGVTQPEVKLNRQVWWKYIPHFFFWLLFIAFYTFYFILIFEPQWGFPHDPVVQSRGFILLFACILLPCAICSYAGYTTNTIQSLEGQDRQDWGRKLDMTFGTLAERGRFPFGRKYGKVEAECYKTTLAAYIANPHGPFAFYSYFSRRRVVLVVVNSLFYAMVLGRWAIGVTVFELIYRESMSETADPQSRALGYIYLGFWCGIVWPICWEVGWACRMGVIARRIRRECLKTGSSDPDTEKGTMLGDRKAQLEWWVQEILRSRDKVEGNSASGNGNVEEGE